jgi:hypothetical protein
MFDSTLFGLHWNHWDWMRLSHETLPIFFQVTFDHFRFHCLWCDFLGFDLVIQILRHFENTAPFIKSSSQSYQGYALTKEVARCTNNSFFINASGIHKNIPFPELTPVQYHVQCYSWWATSMQKSQGSIVPNGSPGSNRQCFIQFLVKYQSLHLIINIGCQS